MAYSGSMDVIPFILAADFGRITVATTGIDLDSDTGDVATMIVPVPLMIYAFGVNVTENLGVVTGDLTLQRSTVIGGTDTTIAVLDFDDTTYSSGAAAVSSQELLAHSVALAASADVDAIDTFINASAAIFPFLVTAPQVLTLNHTITAATITGELAPFIVARWQGIDARPREVWTRA